MYITTKREDSSSVNSAANSRAFQFRLKPLYTGVLTNKTLTSRCKRYARNTCFLAFLALSACLTRQHIDAAIVTAMERDEPLPLAHRIDETLTIERAYDVQKRIVRHTLRERAPIGFKAGLTSEPARKRFNADAPIAGVLLMPAEQTPRTINLSDARGLHLETEVAMRIGRPIRTRIASTEALRTHIDGVAPAIELPNLDYEMPERLTAADIVATNVAAAYFVVGDFVAPTSRDPNEALARLACDEKELNVGRARDAMGDQWTAALWLVNTMIEQGWTLERGQVLLTGALGKMLPAQPGDCVADFGTWGQLAIRIAP